MSCCNFTKFLKMQYEFKFYINVCVPPLPQMEIKPGFWPPSKIQVAGAQLSLKKTFKPMVVIFQVAHYTMKFFFYIKHLLTCGFVTVDSTEKLCYPKFKASIAGHSIPSTFFCTSAVCLLISQNVNKKLIWFDRNF